MTVGQLVKRIARQSAVFDRSKVNLITGLRSATGIGIALLVGLATGHPGSGAWAAAGGLLAAFASFQPGYRRRASLMLAASGWIAAMTLVGGLVGGWTWTIVLLTGLSAFGGGLLVAVGPNAAMVALLGTAEFLFASGQAVGMTNAVIHALQVGAGGLLETLVVAGPWPHRPLAPERQALVSAYRNLSRYAADIPLDRTLLPDAGAIEAVTATLASAPRHPRWGRGRAIQSLADEASRIRESLAALAIARHQISDQGTVRTTDGGRPPDDGLARIPGTPPDERATSLDLVARSAAVLLARMAGSIDDNTPLTSTTSPHRAIAQAEGTLDRLAAASPPVITRPLARDPVAELHHDLRIVRALHGQLRSVQRIVTAGIVTTRDRRSFSSGTRRPSTGDVVRDNIGQLRANLTFASTAFRHALRLAVAATVATILYRTLPGSHEYWIVVGTLMVLKPEFGTTITRGLGRAVGTVSGAVLATLIAAGLRPGPVVLALLATALAIGVFAVYQANYGVYALGLTSMAVFFAAFGGLPPLTAATDRAVDNLIGVGLAMAIFLLWPTWAATEVPGLLGRMLITQVSFARLALDGEIDPAMMDQPAFDQAASRARLDRTNAEAAVERMATEPTTSGPLTIELADGIVAGIHRFGLAAMAIHVEEGAAHRPVVELVGLRDGIVSTMTGLADALVGQSVAGLPDLRSLHAKLVDDLSGHAAELTDDSSPTGRYRATRDVEPRVAKSPVNDTLSVLIDETDVMVDAVDTVSRLVLAATCGGAPYNPSSAG